MFKNKTVFIIGAGASKEAGLPLGTELAEIISKNLNFYFDLGSLKNGDPKIYRTLENYSKKTGKNINTFIEAGRQISEGIYLGESIDNFIDNHKQNPSIAICGKAAIVHSILESEKRPPLYINPMEPNKKLNHKNLEKTWYVRFAKILFNRVNKEEIDSLFQNISIICFNYDRCIQHFLINAIASHYLLSKSESEKIVQRLTIFHPYGSVGSLFQESSNPFVPFGQEPAHMDLVPLINSIKTYSEQIEENDIKLKISNAMTEAETIVFLGFGFHSQNLDLLLPISPHSQKFMPKRIFATALNISEFDCHGIKSNLLSRLGGVDPNPDERLRNIQFRNMECARFFEEFNFSLREN